MRRRGLTYRVCRKAFSLTEIIVVIGIIVVLMALLVPSITGIRKGANRAADIANMRSIGRAIDLFQLDYRDEGRIFIAQDTFGERYGLGTLEWWRLLAPYFYEDLTMTNTRRSIPAYISPGDPSRGGARTVLQHPDDAYRRRSYSFNIKTLDPYQNRWTWRKTQVLNASAFLLFADHKGPEVGTIWIAPEYDWSMKGIPTNWFNGDLANFFFLDGHVESISVKDVMPGGSRHGIFYPQIEE